jgi:hypothetical protein
VAKNHLHKKAQEEPDKEIRGLLGDIKEEKCMDLSLENFHLRFQKKNKSKPLKFFFQRDFRKDNSES